MASHSVRGRGGLRLIQRLVLGLVLSALSLIAIAQPERFKAPPGPNGENLGVDQNLDRQLPLDTVWTDESGKTVKLGDYFGKGKPVIMVPVFYQCRGICLTIMDSVLKSTKMIKAWEIGRDYDIVTFSIHPKETPEMAAKMKKTALEEYGRPGGEQGWHFLVGQQDSITKLTTALGFHYVYDEKTNWIDHPAAIMIITPDGHIAQYFIDLSYVPIRVLTAMRDAKAQKIGDLTEPVWFGCLNRNQITGAMTMNVKRIAQVGGVLTFLILGTSIFVMSRKYRTVAIKKVTHEDSTTS